MKCATHPPSIDQRRGQVDEASDDSPGRIDSQTIEDESEENAPPEKRSSPLELVVMSPQVPRHEDDDEDVGGGDKHKEDVGEDGEVFIVVGPVPDKDPGQIENEVERERDRHRGGQDLWAQIKPE